MTLVRKQKSALRYCVFLLCLGCVLGGIIFFVYWADSTAKVQRYCSGSTLITVTVDHGGSTGVTVKEGGCSEKAPSGNTHSADAVRHGNVHV